MPIYEDLEEKIFRFFNSSPKESLDEIGLDAEEKDKVVFNISSSVPVSLNVDFSDFQNHIFFNSAESSVNFALSRLISEYPVDGELKQKNQWRKESTGYENWFLDNFPKQQGFLHLTSGANGPSVLAEDYENITNFGTSSFTIEFACRPFLVSAKEVDPVCAMHNAAYTKAVSVYFSGTKLVFGINGNGDSDSVVLDYSSFSGSSNYVSLVYSSCSLSMSAYVNGEFMTGSPLMNTIIGSDTANLDWGAKQIRIGYDQVFGTNLYFSGALDEFRIWNSERSAELIKRNFFRPIHANHSGGLCLYYKFNEPPEYGNKVIDYSGKELHGALSGNFSISTNLKSGTLGSWFKDSGDVILALENSRVDSFLTEQRNSGTIFDSSNRSAIFNLVPSFFIDNDGSENNQLFLLLTARHLDRLKLYAEHISNIIKLEQTSYDGPPANLLDLAAKHYGFDIGDVYSNADPLQYYFGENVLATGALGSSVETIRETLKRNILNNLRYILKTKTTKQAIKAALRSVGLDENIVNINEYTDFSGGISTTFSPKTVERRVARLLTGSNIQIGDGLSTSGNDMVFSVRAMFNSASVELTSSILSIEDGSTGKNLISLESRRNSLTSSHGRLFLKYLSSSSELLSASTDSYDCYSNNWNHYTLVFSGSGGWYNTTAFISTMDRGGFTFTQSLEIPNSKLASVAVSLPIYLGSSGSQYFDGYMHEYKQWRNSSLGTVASASALIKRRHLDWESLELPDMRNGITTLVRHLKLNDYTGSASGVGEIHDYASEYFTSSTYSGFSSSADFNFPGLYIDKMETAYSYDLNVDNDKIRIISGSKFKPNDVNYDIPFVSIDFSPVASLNKEITKWHGDLSKFSNLIGDTAQPFVDETLRLDAERRAFFDNRVNSKINFSAFSTLIEWFDDNFSYLISQLIPADMVSSISNYIVEPHIFEYSKVKYNVGLRNTYINTNIDASASAVWRASVDTSDATFSFADPGRFGSPASASSDVGMDAYTISSSSLVSSSNGVNFDKFFIRQQLDWSLQGNSGNLMPTGYGNGFYSQAITGSHELDSAYSANNFFSAVLMRKANGAPGENYLSSTYSASFTSENQFLTGGIQDSRWQYFPAIVGAAKIGVPIVTQAQDFIGHFIGIKYGGGWGQLFDVNKKSLYGNFYNPSTKIYAVKQYVQITTNSDDYRSVIIWPNKSAFNGIEVYSDIGGTGTLVPAVDKQSAAVTAASFGDAVEIEGFNTFSLQLIGSTKLFSGSVGTTPSSLQFEVKFQFFDNDLPGDVGFETILSSSNTTAYTTTTKERHYIVQIPVSQVDGFQSFNFNGGFERSLPKQKYMRVFVTPKLKSNPPFQCLVNIIIKGVLTKDVKSPTDNNILSA